VVESAGEPEDLERAGRAMEDKPERSGAEREAELGA